MIFLRIWMARGPP